MKIKPSAHYFGIALILLSSFCYAALNAIFKKLGHDISALTLVFYRNLFAVIALIPCLFVFNIKFSQLVKKDTLLINIVRGSLGFVGICFWILAMNKMPITECVAISFTTPLFITLMAIIIFKEKVSKMKWAGLICGFIGAIIIVTPSLANFNFYALLVLCASILWAVSSVVVKTFVQNNHPIPIIAFMAVLSIMLSAPAMIQEPFTPSLEQGFWIAVSALLSAAAQLAMAFAYKKAPISIVIPFDFTRLVFASIISYMFFDEVTKASTIIGSIIIVISASYIALLDRKYMQNKR